MKIKAISIKQPWANMIASKEKKIEFRKWKTNYRGELYIFASAHPKIDLYGKVICKCILIDCLNRKELLEKFSKDYLEKIGFDDQELAERLFLLLSYCTCRKVLKDFIYKCL